MGTSRHGEVKVRYHRAGMVWEEKLGPGTAPFDLWVTPF